MKADPKSKAAPAADAAAPPKSKKNLIIVILIVLIACGATAGGVLFLTKGKAEAAPETKKKAAKKTEIPVFVPIEPFTVNLQPENGDQFLQTAITLQVAGATQVDIIKLNMPQVRSRLLLLLSSKKASEINSGEGKEKLTQEIIEQLKQPFEPKGDEQEITGVFFTSFIIQ